MDEMKTEIGITDTSTDAVQALESAKLTPLDEFERKLNIQNVHVCNSEKSNRRHMAKVLVKRRAADKNAKKARRRNRAK